MFLTENFNAFGFEQRRANKTSFSLPCVYFFPIYFLYFQGEEGRVSEENGGIATTRETRRIRRGDERGRGRERGRETQLNVKTLITATKLSTGIVEAKRQSQSPLKMALHSSALDQVECLPTLLLAPTHSVSSYSPLTPTHHLPPQPLTAGVLLLPV